MWINNKKIAEYGGIVTNVKIGGSEINTSVLQGKKRSCFTVLNSQVGMKTLIVSVVFKGTSRTDAAHKKSLWEQILHGKREMITEDGLYYSVVLTKIGDAEYIGSKRIKVDYTFIGIRHGQYKKQTGNRVYCDSTLPYTDCILTVTVGKDTENYEVGSVTFSNVTAGEVLTVDGINARILVNGVPAAERADWIEFPKLVPGWNTLQCDDTLTVEFHPAYF